MPISGQVYQPTTVSYEPRPGFLMSESSTPTLIKVLRKPFYQIGLLVFGLFTLTVGIALIVSGVADYEDTESHKDEWDPDIVGGEDFDIGSIVLGSILTVLAICCLGIYLVVAEWRRNCFCPCRFSKDQSLSRQLHGNGAGVLALNPSTDPLVSHTQYAPVSDIPRQQEDEERRNLMPENKDWYTINLF